MIRKATEVSCLKQDISLDVLRVSYTQARRKNNHVFRYCVSMRDEEQADVLKEENKNT